jgi:4a-hydroxytetrahydrobiopterin dehydratase
VSLIAKHCRPCEGDGPKLVRADAERLHAEILDWELTSDRLRRRLTFADFVEAMAFVNRMAELAEAEGHHPDFSVHYRQVEVVLWTHAVGGLSENDFILAAKIDALLR